MEAADHSVSDPHRNGGMGQNSLVTKPGRDSRGLRGQIVDPPERDHLAGTQPARGPGQVPLGHQIPYGREALPGPRVGDLESQPVLHAAGDGRPVEIEGFDDALERLVDTAVDSRGVDLHEAGGEIGRQAFELDRPDRG